MFSAYSPDGSHRFVLSSCGTLFVSLFRVPVLPAALRVLVLCWVPEGVPSGEPGVLPWRPAGVESGWGFGVPSEDPRRLLWAPFPPGWSVREALGSLSLGSLSPAPGLPSPFVDWACSFLSDPWSLLVSIEVMLS